VEELNEDEIRRLFQYESAAISLEKKWGGYGKIRDTFIQLTGDKQINYMKLVYDDYEHFHDRHVNEMNDVALKLHRFSYDNKIEDDHIRNAYAEIKNCLKTYVDVAVLFSDINKNKTTPINNNWQNDLLMNLRKNMQFESDKESYCLTGLDNFLNKRRISIEGNHIIIETHDPYQFIIGLIEYWENMKYIPVVSNKNRRIINCFKWRNAETGDIKPFIAGSLNNHRKDKIIALSRIKNDLK